MSRARSIAAMASLPQTSCCCETATGLSFTFDPRLPDDFAPTRVVFADRACEFGGRIGLDHDALRAELGLQLGRVHDLRAFSVDSLHHLARCLRRHEKPEPRIEGIPRHGFPDR